MAVVIHRLTKEIHFSAHTPDFSPAVWVVYAKLAAQPKIDALKTLLLTIPPRHVKFDGADNPLEMTVTEKRAVDNAVQSIEAVSDQPLEDGVPCAPTLTAHTITVRKRNLSGTIMTTGTETLRVFASGVTVFTRNFVLVNGTLNLVLGPAGAGTGGEVLLKFVDPAGALKPFELTIRFKV